MRLIDADVLISQSYEKMYAYEAEHFKKWISCFPTIDPESLRVQGEWVECFDEGWRRQIAGDRCSACGFTHYGASIAHYHFCPSCGAKMNIKEMTEDA